MNTGKPIKFCFYRVGVILVLIFFSCTTNYTIHIRTVPQGSCEVFVDKKFCGRTPASGDTVIKIDSVSMITHPVIEVKNGSAYARYRIFYGSDTLTGENVESVSVKKSSFYDITFSMDTTPYVHAFRQGGASLPDNAIAALKTGDLSYCVTDVSLGRQGQPSIKDDIFKVESMRVNVQNTLTKNGCSWKPADDDLTRRITMGINDDPEGMLDSLPYAAWDLATSKGIKYIVAFFGYSYLQKTGMTPNDAAASLGLSALGIAAGAFTGTYSLYFQSGGPIYILSAQWGIISVKENRSVLSGTASVTSYNNNVFNKVAPLCDSLFSSIKTHFTGP